MESAEACPPSLSCRTQVPPEARNPPSFSRLTPPDAQRMMTAGSCLCAWTRSASRSDPPMSRTAAQSLPRAGADSMNDVRAVVAMARPSETTNAIGSRPSAISSPVTGSPMFLFKLAQQGASVSVDIGSRSPRLTADPTRRTLIERKRHAERSLSQALQPDLKSAGRRREDLSLGRRQVLVLDRPVEAPEHPHRKDLEHQGGQGFARAAVALGVDAAAVRDPCLLLPVGRVEPSVRIESPWVGKDAAVEQRGEIGRASCRERGES